MNKKRESSQNQTRP